MSERYGPEHTAGDRLVAAGPYNEAVDPRWGPDSRVMLCADLNAIRQELLDLRYAVGHAQTTHCGCLGVKYPPEEARL